MELVNQIRSNIADFIVGKLEFEAFRAWFAPVFLDVEKSRDRSAILLAYAAESQFAEFSEEIISLEELKRRLREIAHPGVLQEARTISAAGALSYIDIAVSTSGTPILRLAPSGTPTPALDYPPSTSTSSLDSLRLNA
jgi:hypothetical protein